MILKLEVQRVSELGDVPADEAFERWAARALGARDGRHRLAIRIVDEDESRALNGRYRGKEGPTNVLSFASGLPAEVVRLLQGSGDAVPLGDLVMCAPVVAREAAEQGKPPTQHWAHLTIHGILHLLGHAHDEPEAARAMETLEVELLESLGIPDPYAPR